MQKPSQGSRLLVNFELFWCTWPGYGLIYIREEEMPSLVIPNTRGYPQSNVADFIEGIEAKSFCFSNFGLVDQEGSHYNTLKYTFYLE